jgi:Tol biopolymer transport system component
MWLFAGSGGAPELLTRRHPLRDPNIGVLAHLHRDGGGRFIRRNRCGVTRGDLERDDDPVNSTIDFETIAWSPDGSSIAFTENSAKYLLESDVWVLEVPTGRLTNLTDDGVVGGLVQGFEGAEAFIDQAPAWSPDGQRLAFTRTLVGDDERGPTVLFWINAAGGEPTKVIEVSTERSAVRLGLAWSRDGTHSPDRSIVLYAASTEDRQTDVLVVQATGWSGRGLMSEIGHTVYSEYHKGLT